MSQFPNVSSARGAPMGRGECHAEPVGKVRLFRVNMVDGDYDDGGAYWGAAIHGVPPLYHAFDVDGKDDGYYVFIRAKSREAAKAMILEEWPDTKFYR